MSIDEVIEKSTINFPRALALKEAEELIEHLAKKLPANIHYKVSRHKSIGYQEKDERVLKQEGTVNISATVINIKEPMSFDVCEFKPSMKDTSKLSSINFQLIPDYEIHDYRPEVIKLWGDVRKVVEDYFKQ